MKQKEILKEVRDERDYQDTRWGHDADDTRTPYQWAAFIVQYASRDLTGDPANIDHENFRSSMVKVAALAVAAIEAHERRTILSVSR
jgi:hypothetical protein